MPASCGMASTKLCTCICLGSCSARHAAPSWSGKQPAISAEGCQPWPASAVLQLPSIPLAKCSRPGEGGSLQAVPCVLAGAGAAIRCSDEVRSSVRGGEVEARTMREFGLQLSSDFASGESLCKIRTCPHAQSSLEQLQRRMALVQQGTFKLTVPQYSSELGQRFIYRHISACSRQPPQQRWHLQLLLDLYAAKASSGQHLTWP